MLNIDLWFFSKLKTAGFFYFYFIFFLFFFFFTEATASVASMQATPMLNATLHCIARSTST